MKYIKKYNEELHLNPLQMGKKKWNMPGGLSLYTNRKSISFREFEEFITKPDVLKKYFPNIHNKMEEIDKYDIPFDLESYGLKIKTYDYEYVWFKINDNTNLGKYANPFPDGEFMESEIKVENYLIIECDSWYENKSPRVKVYWFQAFKCDKLYNLPWDYKLKSKEKNHGNIKYRIYLYPEKNITDGGILNQDDLDWNQIEEDVKNNLKEKKSKKDSEDEIIRKRVNIRKPFFKELQQTLLDITQNLRDTIEASEIEEEKIEDYNSVLTIHFDKSIPNNNIDLVFEVSKELKQIKASMDMIFWDGILSDYVNIKFSLESGKYGHAGELDLYFEWTEKYQK